MPYRRGSVRMSEQPRRGVRAVEGARLESECRGNSTVGSNPTLSARILLPRDVNWEFPIEVRFEYTSGTWSYPPVATIFEY